MKLCVIYNFAQHYREGIFKAIDQRYDCDWYFGKTGSSIKKMDCSALNGRVTNSKYYRFHSLSYHQGIPKLAFKEYDYYLLLLGPKSISSWLLLLLLKFYPHKKVFGWTHGWYGKESKINALIKKIQFSLADGLFVYGNYAKQLMIKQGFSPDKISVIHNSLDYSQQIALRNSNLESDIYITHFGNSNPVLVFIGRLTPVKRLDLLIEAVSELKNRGHYYNLVFVGDGIEKETLCQKCKQFQISEQTWFYGACYDQKVNAELLFNADLCVAPGNVGLTAMHSMVFGTPVISHNNFPYQMPEFEAIIPGITGDFFEYENVTSLVDTIQNWFDSHKDRQSIRKACFSEIDEHWTPEFQLRVIEKWIH